MSNETTTTTTHTVETMTAALAGQTLSSCFAAVGSLSANVLRVATYAQSIGCMDANLSFASTLDAMAAKYPECAELKAAKADWKKADQTKKSGFRMAWKRALQSLGLKAGAGKSAPRMSPESVLNALRALDNSSFLSQRDKDDFLKVAGAALGNLAKAGGSFKPMKEEKKAAEKAA